MNGKEEGACVKFFVGGYLNFFLNNCLLFLFFKFFLFLVIL